MKSVYSKRYLLSTRKTQITAKKPWKAAVFSIISGKIAKKNGKNKPQTVCFAALGVVYCAFGAIFVDIECDNRYNICCKLRRLLATQFA